MDEDKRIYKKLFMVRNRIILGCIFIVMTTNLVVNLTILLAQTNDTQVEDKTRPRDSTIGEDPTKIQVESDNSTKSDTTEKADQSADVEIQRLFNELRKEYLDDHSEYIDMWLAVIALVLTFFAVVIAIAGYIGFREFRRLIPN